MSFTLKKFAIPETEHQLLRFLNPGVMGQMTKPLHISRDIDPRPTLAQQQQQQKAAERQLPRRQLTAKGEQTMARRKKQRMSLWEEKASAASGQKRIFDGTEEGGNTDAVGYAVVVRSAKDPNVFFAVPLAHWYTMRPRPENVLSAEEIEELMKNRHKFTDQQLMKTQLQKPVVPQPKEKAESSGGAAKKIKADPFGMDEEDKEFLEEAIENDYGDDDKQEKLEKYGLKVSAQKKLLGKSAKAEEDGDEEEPDWEAEFEDDKEMEDFGGSGDEDGEKREEGKQHSVGGVFISKAAGGSSSSELDSQGKMIRKALMKRGEIEADEEPEEELDALGLPSQEKRKRDSSSPVTVKGQPPAKVARTATTPETSPFPSRSTSPTPGSAAPIPTASGVGTMMTDDEFKEKLRIMGRMNAQALYQEVRGLVPAERLGALFRKYCKKDVVDGVTFLSLREGGAKKP